MIGKTLALTRNMHLVTFSSLIHYLAKVRKDIKTNSMHSDSSQLSSQNVNSVDPYKYV